MPDKKYNIILRALEPEDIDQIYKWENNTQIWKVSNTIIPFSRYILTQYIESSHHDIFHTKQLRLMIDVKMKNSNVLTVGTIDLFDFDPYHLRAGIGILIGDSTERGKGFASLALDALISYSFETLLLNQLYCNIGSENKVSLSLFKKHGFVEVGIKKSWNKTSVGFKDEILMQLLNNALINS